MSYRYVSARFFPLPVRLQISVGPPFWLVHAIEF